MHETIDTHICHTLLFNHNKITHLPEDKKTMVIEEHFDADDVLRDVDERYDGEDDVISELEEEMRELNFGTPHDENANFSDMAHDLDTTGDLWE